MKYSPTICGGSIGASQSISKHSSPPIPNWRTSCAYFSQAVAVERIAVGATADFAHQATPRGALEVRCPSCHAPMEVAADTALTDLTCSSCGSHFSLVDQSKATRMAPSLTKLGRFELIERLGVGGFGSVWKARDKELDRTVAIKIPRAGDMTAEEQEKFFREARAAAQLKHPSIVSVHEVGRDGDSVYIVSDFVRGVTLGDWLTGQQLTSREAAELCAKIADALHHAHEQGVVHRDLKPANIMIDGDGQPHLMDFGLARREVGEVTVTMDGQVLGTPAYMSPEQAQGEAHTADRRSDVYSLGVILFQLLTGELPFRGNARMIMHQVIHDEPPSPRKLNANVARDLETIVLKCLNKDPSRRYLNTKELAADLRRYLNGHPIIARPVNRATRLWMWSNKNPALATSLTVTVTSLILGTAIAVFFAVSAGRNAQNARDAQLQAEVATQRADEERTVAERQAREARLRFGQSALALGQAETERRQWPKAIASLEQANAVLSELHEDTIAAEISLWQVQRDFSYPMYMLPHEISKGCFPLISNSIGEMKLLDLSTGHCVVRNSATGRRLSSFDMGSRIDHVVLSDNEAYAWIRFVEDGGALWNTESETLTPISIDENAERLDVLAISDDGTMLVTSNAGNHVTLRDARSSQVIWVIPGLKEETVISAAFSGDHRFIILGTREGTVGYFDIKEHQLLHSFSDFDDWVFAVAFSPNGKQAVVGTGDSFSGGRRDVLTIYDLQTGTRIKNLEGHTEGVSIAKFSPSGKYLVSGSHGGWLFIWDAHSGERLDTLKLGHGKANHISLSRDESLLVAKSTFGECGVWFLPRDRHLTGLGGTRSDFHCAKFSPDGKLFAHTGDRYVFIHETASRDIVLTAGPFDLTPWKCAFTPDGRFLAVGDVRGHVRLFDLKSAAELSHLSRIAHEVRDLDISPDGSKILVGYVDGRAVLFDVLANRPVREWRFDPNSWVMVARFIAPKKCLLIVASAMGGAECDHQTIVYDIAAASQTEVANFKADMIYGAVIDKDRDQIVTSNFGGELKRWNVSTWELLQESPPGHGLPWDISASDDGRYLLTAGPGVTIWNRTSFERLFTVNDRDQFKSISVNSNGRQILAGCDDCYLWDLTDVSQIRSFRNRAEAALHDVFTNQRANVDEQELVPWYRYLGALRLIRPSSEVLNHDTDHGRTSNTELDDTTKKEPLPIGKHGKLIQLLPTPSW